MAPPDVLRDRPEDEDVEVGPIELFFDLVYVFTIIQLSHTLLEHLTWRGGLEVAVLFLAVWWAWNYSAWAMNWIDPDRPQVRVLTGYLMLAALGMAVAIPHAFEEDAALFAGSYVALQLVRSAYMVLAFRGRDHTMAQNYAQLLAWSGFASVFWIAGVFAHGDARLLLWVVGVLVDYLAPTVGFALPRWGATPMQSWTLRAEHLAERNRLVFIIALGETILVMGGTLGGVDLDGPAVSATILGFILLFLLWWNYFNPSIAAIERRGATTQGRSAYAYAHALMVAGAIVVAVAVEMVIAHAHTHMDYPTIVTLFGGPLLYIAGNAEFLSAHIGRAPRNRAVIAAGLVVAGGLVALVKDDVSPLIPVAIVVVLLAALAVTSRTPPVAAAHRSGVRAD